MPTGNPTNAQSAFARRTVPSVIATLAVTNAEQSFDVRSVMATSLLNRQFYIFPSGGDITILAATAAAALPLVAGVGFVVRNGLYEPFWVDPLTTEFFIHYIGTGAFNAYLLADAQE